MSSYVRTVSKHSSHKYFDKGYMPGTQQSPKNVALVSELIQTTKVCLDSQAPWNTQHVKRRCLVMGSVYPH